MNSLFFISSLCQVHHCTDKRLITTLEIQFSVRILGGHRCSVYSSGALFYKSIFNLFWIFPSTLDPIAYELGNLSTFECALFSWKWMETKHQSLFWLLRWACRGRQLHTWHLLPLVSVRVCACISSEITSYHFRPFRVSKYSHSIIVVPVKLVKLVLGKDNINILMSFSYTFCFFF
jgi:hypothetical protein